MLHPSTKQLIDRIGEMSAKGRIQWSEGEDGTCRFETRGYVVALSKQPPELRVTTPDGKEVEFADAGELRSVAHDTRGDYGIYVAELYLSAKRSLRGADAAIESILTGLDLDGDGVSDVFVQAVETPAAEVEIAEIAAEDVIEDAVEETRDAGIEDMDVDTAMANIADAVNGAAGTIDAPPETAELVAETVEALDVPVADAAPEAAEFVAETVPMDAQARSEPQEGEGVNPLLAGGALLAGVLAAGAVSSDAPAQATPEDAESEGMEPLAGMDPEPVIAEMSAQMPVAEVPFETAAEDVSEGIAGIPVTESVDADGMEGLDLHVEPAPEFPDETISAVEVASEAVIDTAPQEFEVPDMPLPAAPAPLSDEIADAVADMTDFGTEFAGTTAEPVEAALTDTGFTMVGAPEAMMPEVEFSQPVETPVSVETVEPESLTPPVEAAIAPLPEETVIAEEMAGEGVEQPEVMPDVVQDIMVAEVAEVSAAVETGPDFTVAAADVAALVEGSTPAPAAEETQPVAFGFTMMGAQITRPAEPVEATAPVEALAEMAPEVPAVEEFVPLAPQDLADAVAQVSTGLDAPVAPETALEGMENVAEAALSGFGDTVTDMTGLDAVPADFVTGVDETVAAGMDEIAATVAAAGDEAVAAVEEVSAPVAEATHEIADLAIEVPSEAAETAANAGHGLFGGVMKSVQGAADNLRRMVDGSAGEREADEDEAVEPGPDSSRPGGRFNPWM